MKNDSVHLGAGALSQTGPHDEFLELCAISASGELTEKEQKRLQEHLAICPSCREALQQYESIIDDALPAIAATDEHESLDPGPRWSQKQAEKRFFDRLEHEGAGNIAAGEHRNGAEGSGFRTHTLPLPSESAWNHVWMLYAAGVLLFAALGLFTYRLGIHRRSSDVTKISPPDCTIGLATERTGPDYA